MFSKQCTRTEKYFQLPLEKKGAKKHILEKRHQNAHNDRPTLSWNMGKHRRLLLLKNLQLLKLLLLEDQRTNNKYKKRFWVRQVYQARKEKGEFTLLVNDLRLFDLELFFRYFRMSPSNFEIKLGCISHFETTNNDARTHL